MNNNDSEEELNNIKDENEFLRLKLMLERGMSASGFDENKLTPEMENTFLKNIEAFEKAFDNAPEKKINLIDFLGKPILKSPDSIPDSEIDKELAKVNELMARHQIFLDNICPVDSRTLYKFITEELMLHEVDDVRIEGMTHHFIYEEFYPNHEHDISEHTTDFVTSFFDKSKDFYDYLLTEEAKQDTQLTNFRAAYKSFIINHFEIDSINHDDADAKVSFNIDLKAQIEGSSEHQSYTGEGEICLKYIYEYWCIDKVKLPQMG